MTDVELSAHPGRRTFDENEWESLKAWYGLTSRELDVVRSLFDTAHRPYIAAELQISVHTVDTHLRRAFAKVGVEDRGDLILALVNQIRMDPQQSERESRPTSRSSLTRRSMTR